MRASTEQPLGVNQESLRRANLGAVLRHVHVAGPVARSGLTALTGLNRSTVANLVAELTDRGLVWESPPAIATGPGRPSPTVNPDPDGAAVLALDLEVDAVAAAVVGLGGHVHARLRQARTGATSPQAILGAAMGLVDELLPAAGAPLVGVGAAVAGMVRRKDGLVRLAPNLGWRDVPLAALLQDALGRRGVAAPVLVGNEADLGALAEHLRGAGAGTNDLLYLSGEIGVGAGVLVDGRPLVGASGAAGEAGHLVVNPEGRRCRCGSTGCWETEIGTEALLRAVGGGSGTDGGTEPVLDALARGEERALDAAATQGRWLGIGLAGLVNVLNPRRVVLGGLLARTWPFAREAALAEIDARVLPAARAALELVPAALAPHSALLGAAELAFGPLLADPAAAPSVPTNRPSAGKGAPA